MIQFLKKRWVYHLLIWLVGYLALSFLIYTEENLEASISESIKEPFFNVVPIFIVVYLGFWTKTYFFDKRKYLLYFFATVAIIAIGVYVYELLDVIQDGDIDNSRTQNISNFIFILLFSVGLQYFKRGIINQYQLQELTVKTTLTELNALKAQINPHFLFNTLNNIYGMNQIDPDKGSEMIMELSDVMRYHLEFSKQGMVRLEDEIQLIQSYIKLERLRLMDNCDVKIDIEEANESILVSPLLFLPFVENAFKHGTHPLNPCHVHLQLRTINRELHFTIRNSIIRNRKVVKTNIGLENTKRRLELIYPNKHQLKISNLENEYLVELKIEL